MSTSRSLPNSVIGEPRALIAWGFVLAPRGVSRAVVMHENPSCVTIQGHGLLFARVGGYEGGGGTGAGGWTGESWFVSRTRGLPPRGFCKEYTRCFSVTVGYGGVSWLIGGLGWEVDTGIPECA